MEKRRLKTIFILLIVFLLVIIQNNVYTEEIIVIQVQDSSGYLKKANVSSNIQNIFIGGFYREVIEIKNIPKLKKLKRIYFYHAVLNSGLTAIKEAQQIEELIISGSYLKDLSFLEYFPNLRLLCMTHCSIENPIFDLNEAPNLQYLGFRDSSIVGSLVTDENPYFTITLANVPETLKYLDFDGELQLQFNDELIEAMRGVPHVRIDGEFADEVENLPEHVIIDGEFENDKYNAGELFRELEVKL